MRNEEEFRPPTKPLPNGRLRRFVRLARLNYRVGGGLSASVKVAWKDSGRHRASPEGER
jgi:hypothetical protein